MHSGAFTIKFEEFFHYTAGVKWKFGCYKMEFLLAKTRASFSAYSGIYIPFGADETVQITCNVLSYLNYQEQ